MRKDELLTGFLYEKDGETYIKVKKQHIKKITQLKLVKEENYKTQFNLVYYDFKDKKGYYAQIIETKPLLDAFSD